ncbi:MAG: TIM barrel protein [Candidatus ainarchaeum sp.]|nr:TIM barrel protein [Candidatus ainarchaeum sp.]
MDISKIRFGTSGNPPNFFKSKFGKDRKYAVEWINSTGLNAYEYLMTYGARLQKDKADYLRKKAEELDVSLSVHGPYYVVLTSLDSKKLENGRTELLRTLEKTEWLGSKKVVLHPGFHNNPNALKDFIKNLNLVTDSYSGKVKVLPETMGKKSQLGSLDEVLEISRVCGTVPCVDFGHLHARDLGCLNNPEDFRKVLNKIENTLGTKALKELHCHFYPVEFTDKGEKTHRAVMEKDAYPKFKDFAPLIKEYNMNPTLISESMNSQDIGALEMQTILRKI